MKLLWGVEKKQDDVVFEKEKNMGLFSRFVAELVHGKRRGASHVAPSKSNLKVMSDNGDIKNIVDNLSYICLRELGDPVNDPLFGIRQFQNEIEQARLSSMLEVGQYKGYFLKNIYTCNRMTDLLIGNFYKCISAPSLRELQNNLTAGVDSDVQKIMQEANIENPFNDDMTEDNLLNKLAYMYFLNSTILQLTLKMIFNAAREPEEVKQNYKRTDPQYLAELLRSFAEIRANEFWENAISRAA